ncbi:hypothetical protein PK28_13460 [Hymenobacter sp. DG25B]|uniref:hypothetical protein n=1 Tax=Hymenobacter sp. DG25B TaxID=1385664 RepID=UPI000540FC09|nr:hypothetical protein [Hymenobacter sp. DG25B]AIZ64429.1 hypothetical protein PK28_13460 [Hymenobacter sp. DG25B]
MQPSDLQPIIDQLSVTDSESAYFGIFEIPNIVDEEYCCIKANSAGLRLYASSLLSAAAQLEEAKDTPNITSISLQTNVSWIDQSSEVRLIYVEPYGKPAAEIENGNAWSDKLFKVGCAVAGIIVLGLVGLGCLKLVELF